MPVNLGSIGLDNGLSPARCQAIIKTNAQLLPIGPLGTNFNDISIKIQYVSLKKCIRAYRLRNGGHFVQGGGGGELKGKEGCYSTVLHEVMYHLRFVSALSLDVYCFLHLCGSRQLYQASIFVGVNISYSGLIANNFMKRNKNIWRQYAGKIIKPIAWFVILPCFGFCYGFYEHGLCLKM